MLVTSSLLAQATRPPEIHKQVVNLRLNEEKRAGDLVVKFTNYGHEHASYGPGEPFAATIGIYIINVIDGSVEREITFYHDVRQTIEPTKVWNKYQFKLKNISDDQQTVTLEVEQSN